MKTATPRLSWLKDKMFKTLFLKKEEKENRQMERELTREVPLMWGQREGCRAQRVGWESQLDSRTPQSLVSPH